MPDRSSHDVNFVPTIAAVSNADNVSPVNVWADPTTHALITNAAGGSYLEQANLTASSLNGDLVASTDVSSYKWVSLQLTGSLNGTLSFQGSNDNSNWVSVLMNDVANSTWTGNQGTGTLGRIYAGPINTRYFRARLTSYSSGTVTGTAEFYAVPPSVVPNNLTVNSAQSGTWTVQPGNTANTTPWLTSPTPVTAGGNTIYRNLDTQSTGVNIKGSAGQVYGWYIANLASSVRYVKLYNKATTPTVGTDTPVITIPIPANAAAIGNFDKGIAFATGIGIGGVTGVADNNSGAPTANDIVSNIYYF